MSLLGKNKSITAEETMKKLHDNFTEGNDNKIKVVKRKSTIIQANKQIESTFH